MDCGREVANTLGRIKWAVITVVGFAIFLGIAFFLITALLDRGSYGTIRHIPPEQYQPPER